MTSAARRARTGAAGRSLLATCVLASALACDAPAQTIQPRFAIGPRQITQAMQSLALPTEGLQVKLAAPITSSIANPVLVVQSASLLDAHSAQMRFKCRNQTECLPFFAYAFWPPAGPPLTLPAAFDRRSPEPKKIPASTAQVESTGSAAAIPALAVTPATGAQAEPDLKVGAPAMLMLEGQHIEIRLRVLCLESGSAGQKIRVSTPDRKQTYVAEIMTPTLLKGNL